MMDTSQFCFSVNFITYLDFGSLFHPRLIALHDHLKWDIQSIAELGHVNKTAHSPNMLPAYAATPSSSRPCVHVSYSNAT